MEAFFGIGLVIIYLIIIAVSFLLCFGLPAITLYFVIKNGNETKQRLQNMERKMEELHEKIAKNNDSSNTTDEESPFEAHSVQEELSANEKRIDS
ncbi:MULTISPECIES: hypothetical protein [Bacillus]|uniref:Uncharacterized protein n=2 Tax=Bacillus TaxID=1386 RepID=A0A0M4FV50_9BACI|nr:MULTISPECIES: hypothetical protein [Bacillus]ALC83859.1 hypothetical protein AM592_21875 [Bacillus gobiensis]MBP1083102.1 putative membrane protein [Bacillus capparidis]MED1097947.1 hypothetical protein [Bacillus capparidis]